MDLRRGTTHIDACCCSSSWSATSHHGGEVGTDVPDRPIYQAPKDQRHGFYDILVLTFNSNNNNDDEKNYDKFSLRSRLRSSSTRAAVIQRTRTKFGRRAFSVCVVLAIWNSVPPYICTIDSYHSFRRSLKSYLFRDAFNITLWRKWDFNLSFYLLYRQLTL